LSKLKSSVNWIRRTPELSFEESCLVHLLGLRVCLYPWPVEFDEVEELIDSFIRGISWTPRLKEFMKARIPSEHILTLHTRLESGLVFCSDSLDLVLELSRSSQIKFQCVMANMPQRVNKPTAAQRAAQSARDKAIAAAQKSGLVNKKAKRGRKQGPVMKSGIFYSKPYTQRARARPGEAIQASAAAAYATGQSQTAPLINATRDSCRIVHRELVGSVTGSSAFAVPFTFALNPGLPASFPWLATQAQAWETYRFNRLRYCYYTRTGSSTPGSCMLVPDYDAEDAVPSSEQIASSYEDVAEDAPWKDIDCDLRVPAMFSMGPKKFIRTGAAPAGTDIKTYDAGQMFVCTTDGTAVNWGKLWCEYDVTLYTPQLNPAGAGVLSAQHFVSSVAPTTANNFGTPVVEPGSANIASIVGNVLTFNQAGRYGLTYAALATTSATSGTFAVGGGGTLVNTFYDGVTPFYAGNASPLFTINCVVNALVGTTITFDTTFVAGLESELYLVQVPGSSV